MEIKRIENESNEELIFRVCSLKSTETWQEIADGLNKELNTEYTESKFRKQFQAFQRMFDSVKHKLVDSNEHIEELEKKQEELYKQQIKTRDKIREHRGIMRQEGRVENLIEVIQECAENMDSFIIPKREIQLMGDNKAILKISDMHIGKVVNNYFNTYNIEVAKSRVNKLVEETIKYCNVMNVGTLYIANIGDNVEGVLRATSRVESEEDIVQQIMTASEILSNMILDFKSYGLEIKYISTLDNHSRANISYKEHIEIESFTKLIDFYIKARLGNTIEFINNSIDENIGYVNIDGKNHFFVHGHLKAHNPSVIIQNLAIPLGIRVDYVHMGHWHKSESKEYHFAKVYVNGSICGTDDYAFNNGWFSKPSQRLLVIENDNEIDFNINLQ